MILCLFALGCVVLRLNVGALWAHIGSGLATVGNEYRKTTKNCWIREDRWKRNRQKVRLLHMVIFVRDYLEDRCWFWY